MQRSNNEILGCPKNHNDPNFDRKFDLVTDGAQPFLKKHLRTKITPENLRIIVDYVIAFQTEAGPSQQYRIDTIYKLKQLAEHYNPKSFRDLIRPDIVEYLNHFRKSEADDPLHKWIGTYEVTRIYLLRFFRWLHRPNDDIAPKNRPKPAVMQNIPKLRRKETSIYKPTDLWTEEDDALFYKYCPSSRDRCYHAVARDTGCRPHEPLKLRIKDVVVQQLENGYQIARITVNGKTGTRHVRLNNSYPRLKEWLSSGNHPYPGNPNAPLFCGDGTKNTGRRLALHSIYSFYAKYKKINFPQLLHDPLVPEDDKRKIHDLLQKPWNPYLRRHTTATEMIKAVKNPKLVNKYFGWTEDSNMWKRYTHYFSDDSFDTVLEIMDGLKPPSNVTNTGKKGLLRPRQCSNCNETNTPESRFCSKCKFVLTFDAFNEATQDAENTKKKLEDLEEKQTRIKKVLKKIVTSNDTLEWEFKDKKEFAEIAQVVENIAVKDDDGNKKVPLFVFHNGEEEEEENNSSNSNRVSSGSSNQIIVKG
jgi:integrase/recombinase XerD